MEKPMLNVIKHKMYHYTKEGVRTLPVWRTSNVFMDFHCVFLKGVRNTCWSHIARVTHQVFKDKQRQLECFFLNLWFCWTAAAFLLPLGFLTNWPPAKGMEPKGNRRN